MKRRGRTVVRLRTEALWARLDLLGRSQNWLAQEVGVSKSYPSTLINQGRAPSGRIRRRMQQVLGLSNFDELFELEPRD